MFRSFLSWRYLWSRRTNLIGIVGIFVGVGALILILSIMTGFLDESRRTLRGSLSDLIVSPFLGRARADTQPPSDPEAVLEAIRADERVEAAAAHLSWLCILLQDGIDTQRILANSQFGQLAGVKLVGIDAADEFAATELREYLTRPPRHGQLVADPDDPFAPPPGFRNIGRPRPSIIVGEQVFRYHDLHRGSLVSLATAVPDPETGEFQVSNREFVVAGTFRSRENEMDLERIYVDRGELASFLGGVTRPEDLAPEALQYSEILVRLNNYDRDAEAVRDDLRERLVQSGLVHPYSDVRTWEDFRQHLLRAIENERVLIGIMLFLVLLVASFTIFAILSMMVTEKRRDIGILTALGATPGGVMSLFLMIGFWDALLGASMGAVVGTWMALEIDDIERWLSSTFGFEIFDRSVYLFDHIPSVVQPLWVAMIVLGAFVLTLVFAAVPAWRAARLDPLDALRYE